jgi:hypothetical protein
VAICGGAKIFPAPAQRPQKGQTSGLPSGEVEPKGRGQQGQGAGAGPASRLPAGCWAGKYEERGGGGIGQQWFVERALF